MERGAGLSMKGCTGEGGGEGGRALNEGGIQVRGAGPSMKVRRTYPLMT